MFAPQKNIYVCYFHLSKSNITLSHYVLNDDFIIFALYVYS